MHEGRTTAISAEQRGCRPCRCCGPTRWTRSRSGIGQRARREGEDTGVLPFALGEDHGDEHGDEQQEVGDARRAQESCTRGRSGRSPMTTAASTATRNERIPAMTAAARPSDSVSGPRVASPAAVDVSPAKSTTERVESAGRQGPHHGRDQLGRNGRQPSEGGVGGAGLDGLADHGAVEEPDKQRPRRPEPGSARPGRRRARSPRRSSTCSNRTRREVGTGVRRLRDLDGDDLRQSCDADRGRPARPHVGRCVACRITVISIAAPKTRPTTRAMTSGSPERDVVLERRGATR